jgi:hypothetical protein
MTTKNPTLSEKFQEELEDKHRHSLLKCLHQGKKVSGHGCVR